MLLNCKLNGYAPIWNKDKQQVTYQHRNIAERMLGRSLHDGEVVHHIDNNRLNNEPSNLLVLRSDNDHMRLHSSHDTRITKHDDGSHSVEYNYCEYTVCEQCGRVIHLDIKHQEQKFCSHECSNMAKRKVDRCSKEELEKLVWSMPTTKVAIMFGVFDKAVENWCKKLGIDKPSRGYWITH